MVDSRVLIKIENKVNQYLAFYNKKIGMNYLPNDKSVQEKSYLIETWLTSTFCFGFSSSEQGKCIVS